MKVNLFVQPKLARAVPRVRTFVFSSTDRATQRADSLLYDIIIFKGLNKKKCRLTFRYLNFSNVSIYSSLNIIVESIRNLLVLMTWKFSESTYKIHEDFWPGVIITILIRFNDYLTLTL